MAYDIGPKIGIEGEAEFKRSLKDINDNLKTLGTEMKAVTSAYDKNDKSAEALTAQNQVLNKQIDEQKTKLEMLKAKLSETADKYGENDEKTKRMQQSVNLATADLNKMERQLDGNKTALEQGNQAQKNMADSSDKLSTSQDKLKNGLKNVAIAAAAAIAAFGAMAKAAVDNADELQRQSDVTGLTAERLQELQYAGNNLGVELDTITGAQAKLTKAMFAAKDGTGSQAAAFSALGISVTDSNGQLKDATAVMGEAFTALNGVANETERDALAMQIFGKSAMELNPMIKAGGDELNRLSAEARNSGAVMSNEAVAGLDSFGDTMDNVKTGIMGMFGESFATIAPAVSDVVKSFLDFTQGVEGAEDALGLSISNMVQKVTEKMPEFITTGVKIIAAIASGLIQNIPTLLSKAPVIIWEIVKALAGLYSQLVNVGLDMIGQIAAGIAAAAASLWEKVKAVGKNIVDGVWEGIKNAKDWLIGKVKEWCGSILAGIKAFFGIKSPSRVMRDEVGIMIARGLGIGIEDGISYARKASVKLGDAITTEMEKLQDELAKMQEQEQKEQADKEVAAYKKSVSDKYDELGKAEKKDKQRILDEIAKLQADWNEKQVKAERDSAKQALQERIKSLEDFKKEYDSAIAEIEKSQQSMAGKLSDYGELLQKSKTPGGKDYLKLGDLQSEIDKITEYGDALGKLKERGISESLMSEITSMNIDDAVNYADLLLKQTPEQYDAYMKLWEEKQLLAADVAKQFYADEFTQLKTEFVDKVPVELSSLKTEMEGIGKNSAQGLADGFWAQKPYIISTFKSVLEAALSEAKASMEIHSPSRKWAQVGSYMAQGLGVGFTNQMRSVAKQINNSIPSGAGMASPATMAVEGAVNGMAALMGAGQGFSGTIVLQTVLDGKVIAQSVVDPLKDIYRQKGVAPA